MSRNVPTVKIETLKQIVDHNNIEVGTSVHRLKKAQFKKSARKVCRKDVSERQVVEAISLKKLNTKTQTDNQQYRIRTRNVNGELRPLRNLRNNGEALKLELKLECEERSFSF